MSELKGVSYDFILRFSDGSEVTLKGRFEDDKEAEKEFLEMIKEQKILKDNKNKIWFVNQIVSCDIMCSYKNRSFKYTSNKSEGE